VAAERSVAAHRKARFQTLATKPAGPRGRVAALGPRVRDAPRWKAPWLSSRWRLFAERCMKGNLGRPRNRAARIIRRREPSPVTRVSRRRQGGESHPSSPSDDKPPHHSDAGGGESFAWSSHLSVARPRKGLAPSQPSSKNPAQRWGQIGDVVGSGGCQELGGTAAMPCPQRREIAVSLPSENRTFESGVPAHRVTLQKSMGDASASNKLSARAAKTAGRRE